MKVSEISLGTWLTHGGEGGSEEAVSRTCRAFDSGVNLFDTANVYPEGNEGQAEIVLGRALAQLPREEYVVATKVYAPVGPGVLRRGLSRKHVLEEVNNSLRRLNLDYIDVYQCHRFDPDSPLEETVAVMHDLTVSGKIIYWGVSEWDGKQVDEVMDLCRERNWNSPISNQLHYSLLWRQHEIADISACDRQGLGVVAFASLAHGVLTGKYASGRMVPEGSRAAGDGRWMFDRYFKMDLLNAVQHFKDFAGSCGLTASQLALKWCLGRDAVTTAVIGASTQSQLDSNIAVSDLEVSPEVIERAGELLDGVRLT